MSDTKPNESGTSAFGFLSFVPIVLILTMYVGSYFFIVRPGTSVWFAPTGLKVMTLPDYRGLPPQLFAPVHYIDRSFLRPQKWRSGRVWSVVAPSKAATTGATAALSANVSVGTNSFPVTPADTQRGTRP